MTLHTQVQVSVEQGSGMCKEQWFHIRQMALVGSPTIYPVVGRPFRKKFLKAVHQLLSSALDSDQFVLKGATFCKQNQGLVSIPIPFWEHRSSGTAARASYFDQGSLPSASIRGLYSFHSASA